MKLILFSDELYDVNFFLKESICLNNILKNIIFLIASPGKR